MKHALASRAGAVSAGAELPIRRRAARPPEAFVAWVWEHRQLRTPLATQDGRYLQVIYPGRRTGSWGPDFRGALLSLDGTVVHGDVEIHVHANDWHLHGHSRDPAYDRTVLHVVLAAEAELPTIRGDGILIPMVALQPLLAAPLEDLLEEWEAASAPPEPIPCRTPEEAKAILERAGMARFGAKAARFEADFTCVDPPQALWTALFEALGYSANVRPFRRLADRVPLAEARAAAMRGSIQLTALLLGEAGLLPHQRGRFAFDDYGEELERLWWAGDRYGPITPLEWRIVGVRPGNGPIRRVGAAALLLSQDADTPLHTRVLGALAELPPDRVPNALRELVLCPGDAYWQLHADVGRPLRHATALVGPERARDIVVNVLLPWAAAVGETSGRAQLSAAAEEAYRRHPPLAANEITRHMAKQIVGPAARSVVRSACLQQGLLHIYRGWCDARDCAVCPAGGVGGWGSGVRG